MTWYQGSYLAGATNRQNFIETVLHPALLAEGWQYVKEWTTSTYVCRTYFCPAANTGQNVGFHVTVTRDSGPNQTGLIYLGTHGKFDAATNTLDQLPMLNAQTNAQNMRADGTWSQTYTSPVAGSIYTTVPIRDTAFNYHLKVKPNYFLLGTAGGGHNTTYIGAYDPLHNLSASAPAIIQATLVVSSYYPSVVWTPAVTAVTANVNSGHQAVLNTATHMSGNGDHINGSRTLLADVAVHCRAGAPYAGTFGRLYEVAYTRFAGALYGDIVTSGGDWFVPYDGDNLYLIKKT